MPRDRVVVNGVLLRGSLLMVGGFAGRGAWIGEVAGRHPR